MTLRLCVFLVIFISYTFLCFGQNAVGSQTRVIQRQLISAQTGLPLQYVQVKFLGTNKQYVSDSKGYVTLPESFSSDSIEFSRLSLIQKRSASKFIIENPIIELDELSYSLDAIDIFMTSNDGYTLMSEVKSNLFKTNPDQVVDYSCMVYNKLVFDIDSITSIGDSTGLNNTDRGNDRTTHLLLIESLSEIKHGVPNFYNERIISGRVSGFKQPSLEYIASQIRPFAFFNKYISILNETYLNPISTLGLKLYQFQIVDSISKGDNTFIKVRFQPKNKLVFSGLKGFFLIDKLSYSIVGVEARGIQEGSANKIFMTQNFIKTDNGLWFPSLLEAKIEIRNVKGENGDQLVLSGTYKSYLTAVNFSYIWEKSDNSPIVLEQPSQYLPSDTLHIENYRTVPLTTKDSITFAKVDSIGLKNKFDKAVYFGRSFAEGFIPINFVKIDFTKIIDYNQREGLTVGIGLYTSALLSPRYTIGGYYRYGFIDNSSKYGGSLSYLFSPKHHAKTTFSYRFDVIPTNSYLFLDGYPTGSSEAYKRFSISEMDLYRSINGDVECRLLKDFKANVKYSYFNSTTSTADFYAASVTSTDGFKNLQFSEYTLRLRWVYNEKFVKAAFGTIPILSFSPYIWFNYHLFDGKFSGYDFQATKLESQIEKLFKSGGNMETSVRITAGKILGDLPSSLYYSSFGNFGNSIGIETAYSFSTMRSNEFYADRFVLGFLRHKIPLFSNASFRFKPILYLNSNIGFSSLKYNELQSFSKGYYESGLLLDNLFKTVFVKYGLAGYYRYGSYHLPNEWNNWAVKISIDFSF